MAVIVSDLDAIPVPIAAPDEVTRRAGMSWSVGSADQQTTIRIYFSDPSAADSCDGIPTRVEHELSQDLSPPSTRDRLLILQRLIDLAEHDGLFNRLDVFAFSRDEDGHRPDGDNAVRFLVKGWRGFTRWYMKHAAMEFVYLLPYIKDFSLRRVAVCLRFLGEIARMIPCLHEIEDSTCTLLEF